MHHIVAALADAPQMVVPVRGVFSHELGEAGKDDDSLSGQLLAMQREAGADIDVVCRSARRLRRSDVGKGPLRQRCVSGIEGVSIGFVNGHVNLCDAVEVGLQSGHRLASKQCDANA